MVSRRFLCRGLAAILALSLLSLVLTGVDFDRVLDFTERQGSRYLQRMRQARARWAREMDAWEEAGEAEEGVQSRLPSSPEEDADLAAEAQWRRAAVQRRRRQRLRRERLRQAGKRRRRLRSPATDIATSPRPSSPPATTNADDGQKETTKETTEETTAPTAPAALNSPHLCPTPTKAFSGLVLVLSADSELQERNAIRRTWGHGSQRVDGRIRVLFHLRRESEIPADVRAEWQRHRDLVFDPSRTLSADQHAPAAMVWIKRYCPDITFVLRADVTVYVNLASLDAYVRSVWEVSRLFFLGVMKKDGDKTSMPALDAYVAAGPAIAGFLEAERGQVEDVTEAEMVQAMLRIKGLTGEHVHGFMQRGNLRTEEMDCRLFREVHVIRGVDLTFMDHLAGRQRACVELAGADAPMADSGPDAPMADSGPDAPMADSGPDAPAVEAGPAAPNEEKPKETDGV